MRIRTIKPEFWSHPVMSRQSDCVRLLAIGLLNLADDEGYFYADPSIVRSALRPFDDDSTIVRAALKTLVQIEYIETFLHPSHGELRSTINRRWKGREGKGRES
jgi:DNA replication protein DnaT